MGAVMASVGRIAISGARGFVGEKLCEYLRRAGYEILPLVRRKSDDAREIFYDYHQKIIDVEKLSYCDAVIHLAGKNVAEGLWTDSFKRELYDSRVTSTKFIAETIAKLDRGPKILLNASAVGIYGDRGDEELNEDATLGDGFLANLCIDWERATDFAKDAGIRVVNMRFGAVLDKSGGMLGKLLPIFKLGLGGPLGSGEQYISFISRDELVRAIAFLLERQDLSGPVNMTSRTPVTISTFTEILGRVLKRPAVLRIPAFILKLLGEQGDMLLASNRVYPKVLVHNGFSFGPYLSIEETLRGLLQR